MVGVWNMEAATKGVWILKDWLTKGGKKPYTLEELKKRDGLTLYFDELSAERPLHASVPRILHLIHRTLQLSRFVPQGSPFPHSHTRSCSSRSYRTLVHAS
ncbi:hypothetical protein PsorP6_016646 [Peronosclerospora sorghi]|uniref:Uncharacterized protein n=1 Tax=Peronosclerospora sorghi TaxID=230839 RepID=A0ACC0VNE6_9STRA|nr:hypothetical protein PsorP6_016646 [Peronosclerospora sorghi]